jgi:hypothetical protein
MKLDKILASGVPVLLWGPPGVGKTAHVYELGRRDKIKVVGLVASLYEPADFAGYPVPAKDKMRFLPPSWVGELSEGGILFLDEINTAPPAVQAALLRVVLERRVGDVKLPDRVRIIAAANPPELAAGGWELAPALANRFVHLQFKPTATQWAAEFPSYWGNPPTVPGLEETQWQRNRALVAAFIHRRPELLLQLPSEAGQNAFPSPRTWDYVSRLLTTCPDDVEEYVLGAVGPGAGSEFLAWRQALDLPTPQQLLDGYPLPTRPDAAFAALMALSTFVQESPTHDSWTRAVEIAASTVPDVAVVVLKSLLKIRKQKWPIPQAVNKLVPSLKAAGLLKGGVS